MLSSIFVTCLLATIVASQPTQAQKFKVLHTFHGPNGALPTTQLTRDAAGNFYGTTALGGKPCTITGVGCGTAFKLDKTGKQVWLHKFTVANGAVPEAGVLRDQAGNLYGTTLWGGDTSCLPSYGCGVVFRLDEAGKETVRYKFSGPPNGETPRSLLVEDKVGNLYGTTGIGGNGRYGDGGIVFEVDTAGHEIVLYTFCSEPNCEDGSGPEPGVIRDAAGNLYGVTGAGGSYGSGTVFELDTGGVETVLYNFTDGPDGGGPGSVLLMDSAGNLYGTTIGGGSYKGYCGGLGCGVVFKLSPQSGGNCTETTLYTFNGTDGQFPEAGPLVRDASGNLYGTTYFGGTYRNCNGDACGNIFKLDKHGKETVLYNFTGGADGATPWGGLTMDKAGNLYGAAATGGDSKCPAENGHGCGVVFKLTP